MDVEETHSRVSFASILGKSVEATFAEGPLTSERGALLLRAVIGKWGAAPGVVSHGLRLRRCDHCLVGSTALLFGAGSPAIAGHPMDERAVQYPTKSPAERPARLAQTGTGALAPLLLLFRPL